MAEPGGEGVDDRQIATERSAGYEAVPVLKAGSIQEPALSCAGETTMTTVPQPGGEAPLKAPFTTIVLGDWSRLDGEQIESLTHQMRVIKAHYIEAVLERNAPIAPLETLDAVLVGLYVAQDVLGGQDLQRRTAFYEACAKVQRTLLNGWSGLVTNCRLTEDNGSTDPASGTESGRDLTYLAETEVPARQPRSVPSSYTLTDEAAGQIRRFVEETPLGKWGATRKLAEQLGVPPKIALQWATQLGCRQPVRRRRRTAQLPVEVPAREQDGAKAQEAATDDQDAEEEQCAGSRSPPSSVEGGADQPGRRSSVRRAALLSADEERRLAALIARGGEVAQKARERLVTSNQGLVWSIARKYVHASSFSLSLEDLVQEGNIGLLRATSTFNPDKGRFTTHATWWIKQAIRRACEEKSRTIRLPSHVNQLLYRVRRARERLTVELEQDPTQDQIENCAQVSAKQLALLKHLPATVSLEQQLLPDEEEGGCLGDLVADLSFPSPEEVIVETVFAEEVQRALAQVLSPRELRVIELRFGMGMDEEQTLAQAGRELGVTRERARQIEERALQKLRNSPAISALRG